MKVPIEWLSEYIELKSSLDEVADRLTMGGLEVEEITRLDEGELIKSGGAKDDKDDRIFVTKVTPNRGDWLSMIGVAREVSVVTGWDFKMPEPKAEGSGTDAASLIKISIADPDLCRRYVGMVIRNVTIKESPDWLKNRLIRAGMRPINNIVDITNYVMLELGQPLHAFDYKLLNGPEIIVRRAKDGETITTIDGIERKLQKDTLVIADRDRAVAVAGVMGGSDSEVSERTTDILLESANFDPVSIRRTSKMLGLVTESSYRFERCVDIGITELAARRAAELIKDLADGEISAGIVDVFPGNVPPKTIEVRLERINSILGAKFNAEEAISYLQKGKITANLNNMLTVTVPTFRPDIDREIDVIEEIARVYGYENIGATLPSTPMQGKDSDTGRFVERLRSIFMACGMQEVLTHSLTDTLSVELTGELDKSLVVRNPLSEETSHLRAMLAPNLLQAVARNQSVGIKDISVFEIGKVYKWSPDGEIDEYRSASAMMVGNQWSSAWNLNKEALAVDFYLIKGAIESLLGRLDVKNVSFVPIEHSLLHPTRAARVDVDGTEIGIIGEISPDIVKKLDIRGRPCMFEINVNKLMPLVPIAIGYEQLPKFPAVYRHLAIVVARNMPYVNIKESIQTSGGAIVDDVELLDVYTGPQVGEDERSLTFSIVFRSSERTLTDEEVSSVIDKIKAQLSSAFGAVFRG